MTPAEAHAIHIEVVREDDDGRHGIPGELIVWSGDSVLYECRTLELDWKNNERNISCIPEGVYGVGPRAYGGFHDVAKKKWGHDTALWVMGVGGRDDVLIHWGNFLRCTKGCLLVGESKGYQGDDNVVWRSQKAFRRLYKAVRPYMFSAGNASRVPLTIRDGLAEDESALTSNRGNL